MQAENHYAPPRPKYRCGHTILPNQGLSWLKHNTDLFHFFFPGLDLPQLLPLATELLKFCSTGLIQRRVHVQLKLTNRVLAGRLCAMCKYSHVYCMLPSVTLWSSENISNRVKSKNELSPSASVVWTDLFYITTGIHCLPEQPVSFYLAELL